MSSKAKLTRRFLSMPSDFTFDELVSFLKAFGYEMDDRGRTSGSAVRFHNEELNSDIYIHRPHPDNTVKKYVLKGVREKLREEGLL